MRGDIDVETRTAARAGTGTPSMVDACRVLDTVFGFEAFRPGQEAVIEALLAGRDVLTVMPTGSGKSLCFQVPALVMDGLTVVVSPLVALIQDQVAALKLAGGGRGRYPFGQRARGQRGRLAPGGGGRDAAALHGARAADDRAGADGARPAAAAAVRHRRGALHLAVGAIVPARVRRPRPAAGTLPRRSRRGADGDRRRGDPPARHHREVEPGEGRPGRGGLALRRGARRRRASARPVRARGGQSGVEALVDRAAQARGTLRHQARHGRQQGGEAQGHPGGAEDRGPGLARHRLRPRGPAHRPGNPRALPLSRRGADV